MSNQVNPSLTPALLRELAGANPPCVTVALQTGGNSRAKWSDVIRQVEAETETLTADAKSATLDSLRKILAVAEEGAQGGGVVLSSPEFQYIFTTQAPISEGVFVGDEFQLRALLPLLRQQADFYILALSQTNPRLLHCTETESREIAFPPDVPRSFSESRQTKPPDHDLQDRSTGGPSTGSMKGVTFGTSSDRDSKDEYLLNFYRMLDRGVNAVLQATTPPLVVVAVDHELALYRSINTYSGLAEPGVKGASDGLKGGEMHKRALELILAQPSSRVRRDLEHLDKLAGTGHASSHAQDIIRAAYDGRISKLFYEQRAEYRGNFDEVRRKIKRHADGIEPLRDLLNEAIVQTLRHGGEAIALASTEIPSGAPFCAIFRYPDPEIHAVSRQPAGSAV